MKPQVLVRMVDDKEFFVVDEDVTADELVGALLKMKNGATILHNLWRILTHQKEE